MNSSQQSTCWDDAKVQIAIRYGLKKFLVNFSGPFARLGSHPKCEIQVPFGQNSVLAYLQVAEGGLAVVVLPPEGAHRCRTQFVGMGESLSLASPITISVVSLELKETENDLLGNSMINSPDALLFEKGSVKGGLANASFLVASGISILGSSQSCQLRLKHRTVAPYQCAVIRSAGRFPSMRIVDLLSHHPTAIGDQIARGQELGVKDTLSIGKMVFVAKRWGNEIAQLIPSSERNLTLRNQSDDIRHEVEIASELTNSENFSNSQCECHSTSQNQLLLSELSRSMASLVARIEKIELTLGFVPLQNDDCVSNELSANKHKITQEASEETLAQAGAPLDNLSCVESPAEAYVLGQLIELRTRDDSRHKSKLILVAVAYIVFSAFGIATLWYRVPSGWKERIWQFCTFTNS